LRWSILVLGPTKVAEVDAAAGGIRFLPMKQSDEALVHAGNRAVQLLTDSERNPDRCVSRLPAGVGRGHG
jgi:hypothetical protein